MIMRADAASVWCDLLVLGLVVCVDEAMAVEELRHDVGLQGHVERRACLLALKQVGVITHLHTDGLVGKYANEPALLVFVVAL